MAEELIQAYYRLTEVVKQYSVKDIDVLHTEKWLPLTIKKSAFDKVPFVFEPDGAVFGVQPTSDELYANSLFRFGFSKESSSKSLHTFSPEIALKSFGLLANRIIAPSAVLIPGVDVHINHDTLYFNTNIFENAYIPRAPVLDDFGNQVNYIDSTGSSQSDEFVILWAYMAQIDEQALYQNFGTLLDIYLPSSDSYKTVLDAMLSLAVAGPTVKALNSAFAALIGTPVVIESSETVEDNYTAQGYKYVVTDKNVYRVPKDRELNLKTLKGTKLSAGDILTEDIKLVDVVLQPYWWLRELETNKITFSPYVFAADLKHQIFFENAERQLTYTPEDGFKFPVLGSPEDVLAFNEHINSAADVKALRESLGIAETDYIQTTINPIDFIFSNVLKNNTALLKLKFYSQTDLSLFFDLLPTFKKYLPPHIYLLVYLNFQLSLEDLTNFNNSLSIPGFGSQKFSIDGSVSLPVYDSSGNLVNSPGSRPGSSLEKDYYKDYINRLFCVSLSPKKDGNPLHDSVNLDELAVDNTPTGVAESKGLRAGKLRTYIPPATQNSGVKVYPTNREIPAILLIDF
jgi:hypothetical protein